MSRSGYVDDCEGLSLWRQAVANAINGKRGQAFLRETLAALDAMPVKRLITSELVGAQGECCTLGAVAIRREMDVEGIDYDDPEDVGKAFGISRAMAAEIEWMNDEFPFNTLWPRRTPETPEERWARMRAWVVRQIRVTEGELEGEVLP